MEKVIYKKQGLSNCLRPDCWKMCFHPEEMCIFHVCLCVCCVFWEEVGSSFTLWTVVWIVSGLCWIVALSARDFFLSLFLCCMNPGATIDFVNPHHHHLFFLFISKCEKRLMVRCRCCHCLSNSVTLHCWILQSKFWWYFPIQMNGGNVSRLHVYVNRRILAMTVC